AGGGGWAGRGGGMWGGRGGVRWAAGRRGSVGGGRAGGFGAITWPARWSFAIAATRRSVANAGNTAAAVPPTPAAGGNVSRLRPRSEPICIILLPIRKSRGYSNRDSCFSWLLKKVLDGREQGIDRSGLNLVWRVPRGPLI